MDCIFLTLLFLTRAIAEEVATPSSLLGPRNFNHHAFASKYLQALDRPETTKQGPVLFPNDAPPPPRPPLIVTSRPLVESIARSELNTAPQNNSLPQSSSINNVIRPYLARVQQYRPFGVATPAPDYFVYEGGRAGYEDYEQRPVLPPIYKVLSEHAKQKVAKIKQERKSNNYDYQVKGPEYYRHRKTDEESHGDDEDGKNYAFSYRVKDKETGDDFSHTQQSSGSATNGEYRVRLPDGRMQIVSYTADENGYQADVRYADDDIKANKNSIDHINQDRYNYNQNQFNGNHNAIDASQNAIIDNHDNLETVNRYDDYTPNQYNNKFEYKNDYALQTDYKTDRNDKYKTPSNDYYSQYTDNSKEYYNDDFSKEYESKSYDYAPHKSKYTSFIPNQKPALGIVIPKIDYVSASTVKPSYDELKDLLVTKKAYNTVQSYTKIPVTISVPSTTPSTFEGTTERVVLIGGRKSNFYTNINNVPLVSSVPLLATPTPVKYVTSSDFSASPTPTPVKYVTSSDFSASPTPMNYLVSTINSLRNKVDLSGPKPVLSNSFIDRINKYLSFN